MVNFCMLFNSPYIVKATVCRHTLVQYNARLFVLCLDKEAEKAVSQWGEAVPITLVDIENYEPRLPSVKGSRAPHEYYVTTKPFLPRFIFDKFGVDTVFFTDADMAFWSDPDELLAVMGSHSLLVTPHENKRAEGGSGYFNVGLIGYRNDVNCQSFLEWWGDRCLEWCEWRHMPDGRLAEQGYVRIIRDQPNRFQNVLECPHPGINLGPWNIDMHKVALENGRLRLDGRHNLVCYHYHEFRITEPNSYYPTGWKHSASDRTLLYEPYHILTRKAMSGTI